MSFPCRARDTLTWGWFRHHRARLAGGWLPGKCRAAAKIGRESTRPVSRSGRTWGRGGCAHERHRTRQGRGGGRGGDPSKPGMPGASPSPPDRTQAQAFLEFSTPPAPDTASEPTLLHLRGGSGWSSPRPTGGSETLNELQCGRYFGQVSMALRPRTGCFISRLYISMPSVAFTRVPVRSGAGIQGAPAVNTPLPAEGPRLPGRALGSELVPSTQDTAGRRQSLLS